MICFRIRVDKREIISFEFSKVLCGEGCKKKGEKRLVGQIFEIEEETRNVIIEENGEIVPLRVAYFYSFVGGCA